MLDFISLILAKPSTVKWALACIKLAAAEKSVKSFSFTVLIGYWLKKGIILLMLSGKLFTKKSQAKPVDLIWTLPQPNYSAITPNNWASLICWVILNLSSTWYLEPLSLAMNEGGNFNIKRSVPCYKTRNPVRLNVLKFCRVN